MPLPLPLPHGVVRKAIGNGRMLLARVGLVVDKFTITVGHAKLCPALYWLGVGGHK